MELVASFDEQFTALAPFLFYVIIGAIVFIETGLLFGFFLPGDSVLFSAGLVAAAQGDINIAICWSQSSWLLHSLVIKLALSSAELSVVLTLISTHHLVCAE